MRAFVACVDYADLFKVALEYNTQYFDEIVVLTTEKDKETQNLCFQYKNVSLFITDAFYRNGATFNRGLAYEEALDKFGREGWICFLDADIVFPSETLIKWPKDKNWESPFNFHNLNPSNLYAARRCILWDVKEWSPSLDWSSLPVHAQDGDTFPGYFQLFHGSIVKNHRPWYPTHYNTAETSDLAFRLLWPPSKRIHLPFNVLHLGPDLVNVHGRVSERLV